VSHRRTYKKIETVKPDSKWSPWEVPVPRGYRLACCDCGLVHEMDFKIEHVPVKREGAKRFRKHKNGSVLFRVARDNRATAGLRRHKEPTLGKTFAHFAADSLVEVYAIAPEELEPFLRRFRARVNEKIKERQAA
jgi:hypothetical protein